MFVPTFTFTGVTFDLLINAIFFVFPFSFAFVAVYFDCLVVVFSLYLFQVVLAEGLGGELLLHLNHYLPLQTTTRLFHNYSVWGVGCSL